VGAFTARIVNGALNMMKKAVGSIPLVIKKAVVFYRRPQQSSTRKRGVTSETSGNPRPFRAGRRSDISIYMMDMTMMFNSVYHLSASSSHNKSYSYTVTFIIMYVEFILQSQHILIIRRP